MKLKTVRILNFRCFETLEIEINTMHALVGANNSGKSTILRALDFLFNPSTKKINEESFCGGETKLPIEIEGIFHELTPEENDLLQAYLRPDGMFHFKRTAELVAEESTEEVASGDVEDKVKILAHYCRPQPLLDWLNPAHISAKAIESWWKDKQTLVHKGQSFATLIGEKKPTVADWRQKVEEFSAAHLSKEDFRDAWTANPQGYANVLKATLPHFVLIPAVRDASDESKVTKTSPFGKLIYEIVRGMDSPFRESLAAKLKETTRLLNREGEADRAVGVTQVENTIKGFLSELMPADLELEFQSPTLEVLLTTPRIIIDDGFRGSVEGKGHGLQRAVIFAILRAYAKLVTERSTANHRPLILGVEEPELYMHPTAQRTIRKVLRSIADGGDQVLFSTHSPLLVDVAYFDEIVRCENPLPSEREAKKGRGKRFQLSMADMISDIERRWPKKKGQITSTSMRERYSHAYTVGRNEGFFAKRVILVEGPTEAYSLPIYAAAMGHDLDSLSVSVIECGNKAQIDRLYRIFNELGISCYVIFDFDRDNTDADRIKESEDLLKLMGAEVPDGPNTLAIQDNFTYFVNKWELDLANEIANYPMLVEEARKELGLRDEGKPLVARYIARRLTAETPPSIPKSIRAIIEKAIFVERRGTCLKTGAPQ